MFRKIRNLISDLMFLYTFVTALIGLMTLVKDLFKELIFKIDMRRNPHLKPYVPKN